MGKSAKSNLTMTMDPIIALLQVLYTVESLFICPLG